MKILDRYIIRQFLMNFVLLTIVFMMLFVLIDLIVDLPRFLEAGRIRAQILADRAVAVEGQITPEASPSIWQHIMGLGWTVGDYYGPMMLLVYTFLSGLLVTAAMAFTFTALARTREVTAVLSSGISMYRVAAPVVVAGCALNFLTLPIQEYLIPPVKEKIARSKSRITAGTIGEFDFQYARDGNGHLFSAARFDHERQQLTDLRISVRNARGLGVRHITAKTADWNEALRRWDLFQGYQQDLVAEYDETDADAATYVHHGITPVPIDYFATDLSPKVLLARHRAIYIRLLSLAELNELSEDPTADTMQIMHSRFSMLAANVLVLVMGLPYFLLREPRNMLSQSIKAAVVCIGAWAGAVVMLQMSLGDLSPVVLAWLPVALYLPVSAAMLHQVRT